MNDQDKLSMCSVRSPSVIHLKHTSKKSQMVFMRPVFAYLTHPQTGCAIVWAHGNAYYKQQCTRVRIKRNIEKYTHITNKNTIRDGGSTALYGAYTVDMFYTVNMVYTVDKLLYTA